MVTFNQNIKRKVGPVIKANPTKLYKGVNQGFNYRDVEPMDETNRRIDNGKTTIYSTISTITEDDFEPKIVDVNHRYYCSECKGYLSSTNIRDARAALVCKNEQCSKFMDFIDITKTKPLELTDVEMETSDWDDDDPAMYSFNPDEQGLQVFDRKEVTYESPDGRIKHVKWRCFPKSLSLADNS